MHNPYKTKLAALAVSFVAVTSVTACNQGNTKPSEPEVSVNPAPIPPPVPTSNPAPLPVPQLLPLKPIEE